MRGLGALALAGLLTLTSCAGVVADPVLTPMTPSEETYVSQTGAVVYRRASVDRLAGLLFSDARGHATCVRSPSGAGENADYTLLVLQRRITQDFISQTDDDVLILRSATEAAACRALGANPGLWMRAN